MLGLAFSCNADERGGHAVFPDFFGGDGPAGNLQAFQTRTQQGQVTTGVDECAERHVSADPAKTVKIGKFCHASQTRNESFLVDTIGGRKACQTVRIATEARYFDRVSSIFYTV